MPTECNPALFEFPRVEGRAEIMGDARRRTLNSMRRPLPPRLPPV
jgi:hypothetical protein